MALKMESITLHINGVSARGLNQVEPAASEMKIYVVVSLAGDAQNEQKALTEVDCEGGSNPNWNLTMMFLINGSAAKQDLQTHLAFTLRCKHALGDRDVGEVQVPVAELLQSAGHGNSMQCVCYPIKTPSGQTQGVLTFEYKFGGSPSVPAPPPLDKPATAWTTRGVRYLPQGYPSPPPPTAGYGGYPPSTPPYGAYPPPSPSYNTHYMPPPSPPAPAYPYPPYNVGPPPATPYGYPPQPSYWDPRPPAAEYGPRSVQTPPKKKKWGWGKTAGTVGGLVGALAVGALAGASAPSFDFQSLPDPPSLSYTPPDISNLVSLPDPYSILPETIDYSSFI